MYLAMVGAPTLSDTFAKTVFTELVSAWESVMSPYDWPSSLLSGTPEIFFGLSPLTVVSGVYRPLSIAAIAVTTLNVEPGG